MTHKGFNSCSLVRLKAKLDCSGGDNLITNARVTVTRKIQLKLLIAHACNPIVPFRIERREPRFCREILQTLLPRSGDVIHPLLWRGSGYETNWMHPSRTKLYQSTAVAQLICLNMPLRDANIGYWVPTCSSLPTGVLVDHSRIPRPRFPTAAGGLHYIRSCWESGSGYETRLTTGVT